MWLPTQLWSIIFKTNPELQEPHLFLPFSGQLIPIAPIPLAAHVQLS